MLVTGTGSVFTWTAYKHRVEHEPYSTEPAHWPRPISKFRETMVEVVLFRCWAREGITFTRPPRELRSTTKVTPATITGFL